MNKINRQIAILQRIIDHPNTLETEREAARLAITRLEAAAPKQKKPPVSVANLFRKSMRTYGE